ncbi:MAG: PGF-CTERM sorting domain-containing protein [Euryarchaeota archaeon]|nr:PGF-CTERM sorting domain-containing protein [Euryarchaeota archaeon]
MFFSFLYFLLLLVTHTKNGHTTINAVTTSTASNQGTADDGVGAGAVTATATPTAAVATPASKVPGFEAIFAVVSLLIVYAMVFRKKGKRSE